MDLDEWRRFGVNVPASLLGMSLVASHSYVLGVMLGPLEAQFGWSRSQISTGPLLLSIATVLLAPFGGRAVDRFSPRAIALIGVPFYAVALALVGFSGPSIASWLAFYTLLAVSLIFIYPTVWTAAIANRFVRNRGLALAVTLSGTGIAATTMPFLASRLFDAYGWRSTYFGTAALLFVVAYRIVLLTFDRDGRPARSADALPPPAPEGSVDAHAPPAEAPGFREFRSPKFARLAAAALIYSACTTMIIMNAVPILVDKGLPLLRAVEVAGLLGIGTIVGRLAGGVLLDRIDGRFVAIGCGLASITATALLLTAGSSAILPAAACLMLGLSGGAEYDACAYLTSRHFDSAGFGAIFGFIGGLAGFAAGMSPIIANAVHDLAGTYDPALWAVMPIMFVACVLFFSLGRYPDDVALQSGDADVDSLAC